MRRFLYLAALMGCGLWYLTFGQWLAWMLLLGLLALPVLSLALSIPAILDFRLAPVGPGEMTVGEKGELLLMGSCGKPMPPFRGKIRVRNLRTGEKLPCRQDQSFAPAHCGGFELTVEKGRVMDYLGIFSFPVRKKQSTRLLVRPLPVPEESLPQLFSHPPVCWKASQNRLGENYELRPYRPGDSLNSVHWKLSAKTGSLTVREAMEPLRQTACVTLSLAGTPEQLDDRLGKLLWIGNTLLEAEMDVVVLAAAAGGTARFAVTDGPSLMDAVDALLCLPAPTEPGLPEPVGNAWHYAMGGEAE